MNEANTDTQQEILPLDDAFIALIAEAKQQVAMLDGRIQGALMLFLRQHGLAGNWQIAQNGREVVRIAERQS